MDKRAGILEELKKRQGEYVSGECLSSRFGISRTAVWKYIAGLRKAGHLIDASTKKGYRLTRAADVISESQIRKGLKTAILGKRIYCFDSLDSTNSFAKKIALEGCQEGTVVIADAQTSGRGRLGRNWHSQPGKGIWMSVVLRPELAPRDMQIVTLGASVAVAAALEKVMGIRAGIKWPNDVILNGRKVCGILSEMSSEPDRIHFVVLGIGLNVSHREGDFPPELRDTAGSLASYLESAGEEERRKLVYPFPDRNVIIITILFELEKIYSKIKNNSIEDILSRWKEYSVTIGRKVKIFGKDGGFTGRAIDITRAGELVVRCEDGTVKTVLSGEVSLRGI